MALSIHKKIAPLRVSLVNLIKQLEKEDQQARIKTIDFIEVNPRIKITLSEEISDDEPKESDVKVEGNHMEAVFPEGLNVGGLIRILTIFNRTLFNLKMNHNQEIVKDFFNDQKKLSITTSYVEKQVKASPENVVPLQTEKLLLIDGSNMLSRGYYATSLSGNLMQTSDGRYTNAVYSMVRGFFNLLEKHQPTKVCVLWDKCRSTTWRRRCYPKYKANRSETDPELKEQFLTAQNLFRKMGVIQMSSEEYEADDYIGTLATKYVKDNKKGDVLIVSSDKDLYQLLNDRTTQIAFHKGKELHFSINDFMEKYAVNPNQWVDIKAILGDKSDNLPGVSGCGEKAAFPIISQFNSLEELYQDLSKLEPNFKRYIKKFQEGKENAFLTKRLATLVTNIEGIGENWNDLQIKMSTKGTVEAFKELEFDSLLEKIS